MENPQNNPGKVICFFGTKGGAGTTTIALNTALSIARSEVEKKVALCDLDLQFGDLNSILQLDAQYDLCGLIKDLDKPGPITGGFAQDPRTGVHILPSPQNLTDALALSPDDIQTALNAIRHHFDYTLIDTPCRLDLTTLNTLELADKIFLITEPLGPSLEQTARLLEILQGQDFDASRIDLVLNKYDSFQGFLTDREIEDILGRKPDITIPFENKAFNAQTRDEPIVLNHLRAPFTKAINTLAQSCIAASQLEHSL